MDDLLFARELADVLAASPYGAVADLFRPAGGGDPLILPAQAPDETGRPLLLVNGNYTAYGFARRRGDLLLEIRSRVGDETPANENSLRVQGVITALLGAVGADDATTRANAAAALATLQAALLDRGQVQLHLVGPSPNFCAADIDGEDLRTTLTFRCAWEFLPHV